MPFNHFILYADTPPVSELQEIASYLEKIVKNYATVEAEIRKVALKKGCPVDELLFALFDEHWEPLQWRMRTFICLPSRSREAWVDEEIQATLKLIGHEPIRRELKQIWEGFKAAMEAAESAGKVLEWYRSGRLRDDADRVGKEMSEEQQKRAFAWLMLHHEGEPEDVSWSDAVMAIWKAEVLEKCIANAQ